MNRRSFIGSIGAAVASFCILPSATAYTRQWKPAKSGLLIPNPEYFGAPYEIAWLNDAGQIVPVVWNRQLKFCEQWKSTLGNVYFDNYPIRFKTLDASKLESIQPFVEQ